MKKVTKPQVKVLASGTELVTKQMQAAAGDLLPQHLASLESVLFIHKGECILDLDGEEKILKQGDAFIVPPKIKHQIKAITDFKGIHFMPKEIRFEYF